MRSLLWVVLCLCIKVVYWYKYAVYWYKYAVCWICTLCFLLFVNKYAVAWVGTVCFSVSYSLFKLFFQLNGSQNNDSLRSCYDYYMYWHFSGPGMSKRIHWNAYPAICHFYNFFRALYERADKFVRGIPILDLQALAHILCTLIVVWSTTLTTCNIQLKPKSRDVWPAVLK